jgi:branched-chain amino acid transport system substrate-binding protein
VLYTYGAMQIWAAAAEKAKTVDARKVADALKRQGPWGSVLGQTSFTPKGDVTVPDYVFYVWRNGTYAEM